MSIMSILCIVYIYDTHCWKPPFIKEINFKTIFVSLLLFRFGWVMARRD